MAYRIEINHGANGRAHRRARIATPSGRIAQAFAPFPDDARRQLFEALRQEVKGEVRFDAGSRALYATDASNYRQVPLGVVVPRSLADVEATVALCDGFGAPILPRGAGTSLAGETCNVAVVLDFSKHLNRILALDPKRCTAVVEPGCVLDTLRGAAETHHLTFGPDPATHDHNTLGGMIGNNSCGVHSVYAGRTSDNVEALDILTYDGLRMTVGPTSAEELKQIVAAGGRRGEIYRALDVFRGRYGDLIRQRYPKIPRLVSGYENLDQLLPENGFNVARALVGTEATCVLVLGATVTLVPSPPERALAIVGFKDIVAAADAVPRMLGFGPIGLEGIDRLLVRFVRLKHLHLKDIALLPDGEGWLVAEFGGRDQEEAEARATRAAAAFDQEGLAVALVREPERQAKIWELRDAALAATAHVPGMPETWPGWEDSAVPREALGDYLRALKALFSKYGYEASVYGHFGDGLVHCRVPFDLRTETGVAKWRRFLDEAADLVVGYGGSLSGEHGDGEARGALLEKMYGADLVQAFREFKAIWDPHGRMNPGKVVDPFPITANLRVGPAYQPPALSPAFAYAEDGGSFARATRRCVGVGACRRTDSDKGVMCPSYMATREEKYSTRGRARLLFEMLHGGIITDGWRSRAVEEALDLCLACKGCKSDCPVHVDMATYKAEFRARHYAGRLRPRAAYSMGLIHRWARVGGHVPALANALTGAPVISDLVKWAGGIAPQRRVPAFAPEPFTRWFRRRKERSRGGARVLLWPDTFNNHFRVGTAIAATRVLEALGYEVAIPDTALCCGRPLYDWGRIEEARRLWRRTFDVLGAELREGTSIIGLEPACVSAFRDELPGLFPGDERAERLARSTWLLTEFLDQEGVDLPELSGALSRAHGLVQLHCHHHAVLDAGAQERVLQHLRLRHEVMASGCCGMAGAFGFERGKYDVAMAAAQRVLLPRVREADAEALILADGFSCREQIEQASGRTTLHMAEFLAQALHVPGS